MRIGVVLFDRGPEIGGGYTYELELLRSLLLLASESEHSFTVFSNRYLEPASRPIKGCPSNVEFMSFPAMSWLERLKYSIKLKFALARIHWSQETRLDSQARRAGVEFIWFVGANPVMTDLPYLATIWDLQHRLQPWFPEVSAGGLWDSRETFYCWFLQRAAMVVTGNKAGQREAQLFYQLPSERFRLLPHMTPSFALENAGKYQPVPASYKIPDDFLFYPAQFWSHKNHVNLLYAIRDLKLNYGQIWPLVFVGSDHGNLEYIRKVTRELDLDSQVHFLGFIPKEDLIALYQNAFALVYVSFFGPENLPPMEAFALGCPVIASAVDGADEQFGDAALLVNPAKPDEITAAIRRFSDDLDLRESCRKRGIAKASEWTGDDYVREMFKILDEFAFVRRCWDV